MTEDQPLTQSHLDLYIINYFDLYLEKGVIKRKKKWKKKKKKRGKKKEKKQESLEQVYPDYTDLFFSLWQIFAFVLWLENDKTSFWQYTITSASI